MHINRAYVRRGGLDAGELLIAEDVTDQVAECGEGIEDRIAAMFRTIGRKACPEVDIGPHCSDPYDCPLRDLCWREVNGVPHNIFTLARLGARAWELYARGVIRSDRIPAGWKLSAQQRIQIEAERSGKPNISKDAVGRFLSSLVPPVFFLDFESFQTAVPLFDNCRPYQQIPFQFSLHVAHSLDAEPAHHSWLWDGRGDPRGVMLRELKRHLGDRGSIVAYNAQFEKSRLKESAAVFPEHARWVQGLGGRIVDLMLPFKSFAVYFPAQHGSASMKQVLPALTGRGYEGLAIADGNTAGIEFQRVMFTKAGKPDREKVRRNLEEYCGLDTFGMLEIVRAMRRLT
jgi:hypothetical protein